MGRTVYSVLTKTKLEMTRAIFISAGRSTHVLYKLHFYVTNNPVLYLEISHLHLFTVSI